MLLLVIGVWSNHYSDASKVRFEPKVENILPVDLYAKDSLDLPSVEAISLDTGISGFPPDQDEVRFVINFEVLNCLRKIATEFRHI